MFTGFGGRNGNLPYSKRCFYRRFFFTVEQPIEVPGHSRGWLPVAANVLNRRLNSTAPNIDCVSDITYVRTGAGWLYLAAVIDLYGRKVVSWARVPSMSAQLVRDALNMAISSMSRIREVRGWSLALAVCLPRNYFFATSIMPDDPIFLRYL